MEKKKRIRLVLEKCRGVKKKERPKTRTFSFVVHVVRELSFSYPSGNSGFSGVIELGSLFVVLLEYSFDPGCGCVEVRSRGSVRFSHAGYVKSGWVGLRPKSIS